jgi:excisionase family DNA binding protein
VTSDNFPLYMKIEETCRFIGLRRSKVYDLLGEGKLRAKKAGKCTLVETASVVDYMNTLPDAKIGCAKKHANEAEAAA